MDRRRFLQAAAVLGGSFATRAIADLSQSRSFQPQPLQPLIMGPSIGAHPSAMFNARERADITAMVDVILPRTDTPGAVDAGVPNFVEYMVQQWLSDAERKAFMLGLANIARDCQASHDKPFSDLSVNQQLAILTELEDQASDSPWYDFANVQRQYIESAPFICQLKELTIFGFYSSEVGAKEVLRHDPMPMQFDGEFSLSEDDSTWSMIRTM